MRKNNVVDPIHTRSVDKPIVQAQKEACVCTAEGEEGGWGHA